MKIKLKEVLLRTSILGGICTLLISPTLGMIEEEDNHRASNQVLATEHYNKGIFCKNSGDDWNAINYFYKSATLDHARAQRKLGLYYDDFYAKTQYKLGLEYENWGNAKNAINCFHKAVSHGYNKAQNKLEHYGKLLKKPEIFYTIREEIEDNYEEVFTWLRNVSDKIQADEFSKCNLTDKNAFQVAFILSEATSLPEIYLNHNKLTSKGLSDILKVLQFHKALTKLDLSYNRIDPQGGKELLTFFEKNTFLKEISVAGNPISPEIENSIRRLNILRTDINDISENVNWYKWYETFSSCDFTDKNAIRIVDLFSKAKLLSKIDLNNNKFTSHGLHQLLNAFQYHPTLVELDISNNHIDDVGGKELLSFFETHPTLKKLLVHGNRLSEEMAESIRMMNIFKSEDASAQMNIGEQYYFGRGVRQSYAEAMRWYRRAAEEKNPIAQYSIGALYDLGEGVKEDCVEAMKWYFEAADQGHGPARDQIFFLYKNKTQVEDYYPLLGLFRKAVYQNDSNAQCRIGMFYHNGQGVRHSYAEAMRWYLKAASQNDPDALYNLGGMYLNGQGVEKDKTKALECFSKVPARIKGNEFFSCDFTDKNAAQLASLLSKAHYLSTITLAHNKFTTEGLKDILNILTSHPNLIELDISNNLIDDEGGHTLLGFFEKHPYLKKVLVDGNPLMGEEIKRAIKKREIFRVGPMIDKDTSRISTFSSCGFTDENAPQLAGLLYKGTHLRAVCKEIYLNDNSFTSSSLKDLLRNLPFYTALVKLDISNNFIKDKGGKELLTFFEKHASLKEMVVTGNLMSEEMEKAIESMNIFKSGNINAQRNIGLPCKNDQEAENKSKKALKLFPNDPTEIKKDDGYSCGFDYKNAPLVEALISTAQHRGIIKFAQNKFTNKDLKFILNTLQSRTDLIHLDFSNNLIDDEGGKELLTFLKTKLSLETIFVDGNPMSQAMQRSVRRFLSLRITPLKIIDTTFFHCDFTDKDASQVAYLLSKAAPLTKIDLSSNKFTSQDLKPILGAFQQHPTLIELDIRDNLIDDEGGKRLLEFFKTHPSLKKVLFVGNNMSQEMEESLNNLNIFKSVNINAPRDIGLSFKNGKNYKKALEWFQKEPTKIHKDDCSSCDFTDEDASQVASVLSKTQHLTSIDLKGNKFTTQGLKEILKALQTYPNLLVLDIGNNLINDEGGKELLTFLKSKPSLRYIFVNGNPMSQAMQRSVRRFLSLTRNPLEIIGTTFVSCDFTDEDAPQVASLLSQGKSLSNISLISNKFTSQSLMHILNALQSHSNLLELDIRNNLIDDEGGKTLLAFIEKHISLKQIFVDFNPMSDNIKKLIHNMNVFKSDDGTVQLNIGDDYYFGRRVMHSDSEAMKWYRRAAKQKNALAQYKIGALYENGQGVEQNYVKAMKWYRKAANQDNVLAQYKIGLMYLNGQGVKKDYTKAFGFFSKVPGTIEGNEFFSCGFEDDEALQLASLLSKAKHLSTITLAQNKFTTEGLKDILNILTSHPNLIELDISNNDIDDEGGKALLEVFKTHPSLKKVIFVGNNLSKKVEESINNVNVFKRGDGYAKGNIEEQNPSTITGIIYKFCNQIFKCFYKSSEEIDEKEL
ncbi:MAG: SEL1-like repeat protein [Alphaproteobacteria bacterium]|nr:SEL1-like repeat protein [Alphaproteobacteria bacterium]